MVGTTPYVCRMSFKPPHVLRLDIRIIEAFISGPRIILCVSESVARSDGILTPLPVGSKICDAKTQCCLLDLRRLIMMVRWNVKPIKGNGIMTRTYHFFTVVICTTGGYDEDATFLPLECIQSSPAASTMNSTRKVS